FPFISAFSATSGMPGAISWPERISALCGCQYERSVSGSEANSFSETVYSMPFRFASTPSPSNSTDWAKSSLTCRQIWCASIWRPGSAFCGWKPTRWMSIAPTGALPCIALAPSASARVLADASLPGGLAVSAACPPSSAAASRPQPKPAIATIQYRVVAAARTARLRRRSSWPRGRASGIPRLRKRAAARRQPAPSRPRCRGALAGGAAERGGELAGRLHEQGGVDADGDEERARIEVTPRQRAVVGQDARRLAHRAHGRDAVEDRALHVGMREPAAQAHRGGEVRRTEENAVDPVDRRNLA